MLKEPGMLSSIPTAAGSSSGEHRCVLAARDDELQKWYLHKAFVIRDPCRVTAGQPYSLYA